MPNWKKVVVSGSDATLNSLTTTGGISSSGDVYISSSKNLYVGPNTYIRRELNSGGYEYISLNGSVRLQPNTAASANNGVIIGGNGYLLSANSSRNAQLNYGGVSGQMGIYQLNVYGNNAYFQNNIIVTGSITGSDITIDDWGSVSASLAAIEAGATSTTLQEVTSNGNTTTNSIIITGSSGALLKVGENGSASNTYITLGGLYHTDGSGDIGGGAQFAWDGNEYQLGTDGTSNLKLSTGNTGRILISASTDPLTAGTKVGIGPFLDANDIQATLHVSGSFLTTGNFTSTSGSKITGSLSITGSSTTYGIANVHQGWVNVQSSRNGGLVFFGRREAWDTDDSATLFWLYNSGSTGQAFGRSSRILLQNDGVGSGTIYHGVNGKNELVFELGSGTKFWLSGSSTTPDYLFATPLPGSTSSLSWNQTDGNAFIQKPYTGTTQFIGNATTATTATTASYVAGSNVDGEVSVAFTSTTASYAFTSSYSSVPLSTVLSNGNTANNSIYLNGLWNNVLRIGLEGGTVPPAPSQSVGLGLHGSQIYWSGSTPDGGTASTPATNNKAVDQFHYDNNNISIGGKLYVFSGVSIGSGSFHSVHCDYTLFSSNNITNNVSNVRAGSLIVAVDDSNRISYTEYSTPMTSGSQDIDTTDLNIEIVGGALQCWISSASSPYSVCKSRITIM